MGYSQLQRDRVLNWYRGTAFPAVPTNIYVALLTTNPTDETGTGLVEVSTGTWSNYARLAIAASTGAWAAPSGTIPRQISNAAIADYGNATTSGNVTITGIGLYDAITAGNFLGWVALTGGNKTISNGDDVNFAIGALVISE